MNTTRAWTDRYLPAALLVAAAVLVFSNLDGGGLRNGDEARYAIVADEILRTGDAVTLHYEGQPYFQKAPLRFWISALTYAVFGVNEVTVRFWSALAGLGCIAAVWWLGRRFWGAWAGLGAALILATTPAFLHVHGARTGEMDTLMTLCWLLALVPLTGDRLTRRGFLFACFFAALCGMAKHLAFAPLAFLTLGAGLLITGQWRGLTWRLVAQGAVLALFVVAPWHLTQWAIHGNLFWEIYLGRVVVETAFAFAGPQPGPGFYLEALFAGGWPWPFLWAAGFAWCLVNARRHRAGLLPVAMVAVVLLFTVVAQRKLAWYVIPAYPALALMAGGALSRGLSAWSWRTTAWTVLLSWSAFAAFRVGIMTWLFADRPAYRVPLDAEFLFQLMPRPGGPWGLGLLFGLSILAGVLAPSGVVRPDRPLPRGTIGGVLLVLILGVFAARNAAAPVTTRAVPPMKETVADLNETLDPEGIVVIALHRDRPRDDVSLFYLYRLEGKLRRASPAQGRTYLQEPRFAGMVILPEGEGGPPDSARTEILARSAGCLILQKIR